MESKDSRGAKGRPGGSRTLPPPLATWLNIKVSVGVRVSFVNDELRLLAYFENTWIAQPVGGRRFPPIFLHHMWNVCDRPGSGSSRTTNTLKAFHHNMW